MCNQYSFKTSLDQLVKDFGQLGLELGWEGGAPNLEPRDIIRPTDPAPVIVGDGGEVMLKQLRWGFPRPKGGPVINFRSDGRRFPLGRCLIPADSFYEFTGTKTPKTRWRFTAAAGGLLGIAGLVREDRFTMLTTEPGPDISPYHDRQVVLLSPSLWGAWLREGGEGLELGPAPAGTLAVERISGIDTAQMLPFRS